MESKLIGITPKGTKGTNDRKGSRTLGLYQTAGPGKETVREASPSRSGAWGVQSLEHRLRTALDGLPDGSMVTLPVATLLEWVQEDKASTGESTPRFEPDLTVKEVARLFNLSENTITRYIREGKLRAYKRGKEYRITPMALNSYQLAQQAQ